MLTITLRFKGYKYRLAVKKNQDVFRMNMLICQFVWRGPVSTFILNDVLTESLTGIMRLDECFGEYPK